MLAADRDSKSTLSSTNGGKADGNGEVDTGSITPVRRTPVVPIVCCGVLAEEACRRRRGLTVAAVFARCIYLRSGTTFLCVGEPSLGNGPLTLVADCRAQGGISGLGLRVGQPAQATDCGITIGASVSFRIGGRPTWRQPRWPHAAGTEELTETAAGITRRAK